MCHSNLPVICRCLRFPSAHRSGPERSRRPFHPIVTHELSFLEFILHKNIFSSVGSPSRRHERLADRGRARGRGRKRIQAKPQSRSGSSRGWSSSRGDSGPRTVSGKPDYVQSSAGSGGLAKVVVFPGSRASLPADGARGAAFASLARAGSPRSQEGHPRPWETAGPPGGGRAGVHQRRAPVRRRSGSGVRPSRPAPSGTRPSMPRPKRSAFARTRSRRYPRR